MAAVALTREDEVFFRGNMICKLDTVTYVSAEHGEMETVVEVCRPYMTCETKEAKCPCEEEKLPEEQVFTSPEFGDEIEASI